MVERRHQRKEAQRTKISQLQLAHGHVDYLSLEHGVDEEEAETVPLSRQTTQSLPRSHRSIIQSNPSSRVHSRATSQAPLRTSSRTNTPLPTEFDIPPLDSDNEDETPGPSQSISSNHGSSSAIDGTTYGSCLEASSGWGDVRDYIAVQIGGHGIAMKEDHCRCSCSWQACVNVGHCGVEHGHVVLCEGKIGRYCLRGHLGRCAEEKLIGLGRDNLK